jgi:hypothetical protein
MFYFTNFKHPNVTISLLRASCSHTTDRVQLGAPDTTQQLPPSVLNDDEAQTVMAT